MKVKVVIFERQHRFDDFYRTESMDEKRSFISEVYKITTDTDGDPRFLVWDPVDKQFRNMYYNAVCYEDDGWMPDSEHKYMHCVMLVEE